MNDKRPKDFYDLFTTFNGLGNVYNHIDDRKDYLVEELLDPSCTGFPLSRVYLLQRPTNDVLHFLDEWVKKNHIEQSITEFSDVNKVNPKTGKKDLNYSQKFGRGTTRCYAFYLDKLKIDNRK